MIMNSASRLPPLHPLLSLLALTSLLLAGCSASRPALTPAGEPDPSRRMALMGWYPDPAQPKEAVVITFAYPSETSLYHTKTLRVGSSLHQYHVDAIEPGMFPQLNLTDLDTKKPVVLRQDNTVKDVHFLPQKIEPSPAPVPATEPQPEVVLPAVPAPASTLEPAAAPPPGPVSAPTPDHRP